MATNSNTGIVDLIINGLRDAATELEELRVQLALGKSEAKDLFEEVKIKLREKAHQGKLKLKKLKDSASVLPVINALEHLQVQLALGLAESEDVFEQQRRQIEKSLAELERKLKQGVPAEQLAQIQLDIEHFRAKVELIALGYKLKKLRFEYDLRERKAELDKKLEGIRAELGHKEEQIRDKWQTARKQIRQKVADLRSLILPAD